MTGVPGVLEGGVAAFLLAFPALFSIVNPIGGALVFSSVTGELSHAQRGLLARRIAVYSVAVLIVSLSMGSYVLAFFGVTLGALRVAGGLVVALRAWDLLTAPERQESAKQRQAAPAEGSTEDVAFFPLTVPFTTGPGTISVAVALGGERPPGTAALAQFFGGMSLAAVAIAGIVWLLYAEADRVLGWIGPSGARVLTRLIAFLLLCIGVQILSHGVEDLAAPLLEHAAGPG